MSTKRLSSGALLLSIGTIWAGCSSSETDEPAAGQPGSATAPPATTGPAPTGNMPQAPGGTTGNAPSSSPNTEGNDPGSVDTSMLDNMPGTGNTPGGTGSGNNGSNGDPPPADDGAGTDDGAGETGTDGETPGEPPADGSDDPTPEPPVANCPAAALAPGDTTRTLSVGNVNRSYILHVPSTYTGTQAVPLLFDFHGLGGNGQQERNGSSYVAATQSDSVILAFPSGVNNGWDVGECCVNADDVGFTRAMVADIQSVACIDAKRIYASGFSNGGGMSYKLACDAADIFAAVAPGSFDFGTQNVNDCNPARPISIVAQRGTNDFAVPFEGGPTPVTNTIVFLGAQATFDKWSELNGCTAAATDIGNNCTQITGCGGGTENTLCVIQGGGHEPPRANLLWPILREYTLP